MSRPGRELPVPPRLPPDLSSDHAPRLTRGTDLKGFTVEGDFSESVIEDLLVEDSHITRSSFTAAGLPGLRLIDVLVEGSDLSGADMEAASFTRVRFTGCRLSGALLSHARMQDVTFSDVKLDGANFRMCVGERILFDFANLERADFYSAQLKFARFFDCDLRSADVSQAVVPGARFHGSVLSELKGSEYLRDVVIDTSQVLPLATGVFGGLNIRIEDDRERDASSSRKKGPATSQDADT